MPINYNPTMELLTPDELAKMLKISRRGVYRLMASRKIRFHKVRGGVRFDMNDILAYLQENRIDAIS